MTNSTIDTDFSQEGMALVSTIEELSEAMTRLQYARRPLDDLLYQLIGAREATDEGMSLYMSREEEALNTAIEEISEVIKEAHAARRRLYGLFSDLIGAEQYDRQR